MFGSQQIYLIHRDKMGRQRNMPQIKAQEKSLGRELNEMESTKITDAVFKTVVIRMFKDLRGRMDNLIENLKR